MSALGPLAWCPGCRDVPSVAWRLLDCGEGCPPAPCVGLGSGAGSLGRVSVACGPLGSGSAADPGREAADELDVSRQQSSFGFYLHFYHMYMYRALSLRRSMYRRTPDFSRTLVAIVVRTAVFRARGPGSIPYRCSLPLTSEFASRSCSPYPALNTHLGGFACGPRLRCGGSRKKGRRDLVTRSLLRNPVLFSSSSKLRRRDLNWRSRRCIVTLNPLDQERRALLLKCRA